MASRIRIAVIAALITLAKGGGPLYAATELANTSPSADAYEELYTAIEASTDYEKQLDGITATLAEQLIALSPEFKQTETRYPGFGKAIAAAMRPVLRTRAERLTERYHPRKVELFRRVLTQEEARDAAEFYRSRLGRKLLTMASANQRATARVAKALHEGDATLSDLQTDKNAAADRTIAALSPAELAEFATARKTRPGLAKAGLLARGVTAIDLEMGNEPMTPEEENQISQMLDTAIERHIAKFTKRHKSR